MKKDRIAVLAGIVALLLFISVLQNNIADQRREGKFRDPNAMPLDMIAQLPVQDMSLVTIGAILGGFRSIAVDLMWMKCDDYWESGRWFRMLPLARSITRLEPSFVEVWYLTGWQLAYNMSVEAQSIDECRRLIYDGIEFMETGSKLNPEHYRIPFEIGWTYYDKLNLYDEATHWFVEAIKRLDATLIAGKYPKEDNIPRYIERLPAHGYERFPDFDKALKWYHVSLLKHREYDNISLGAIETILERYWPAWKIFKQAREDYRQGRYDGAIVKLQEAEAQLLQDWVKWQANDPIDPFALHFQARIYELMAAAAEAKGDGAAARYYDRAFDIWWECMDERAMDKLARRRLLDLYYSRGKPEKWKQRIPRGMNPYGLPEDRVVGETEGTAPPRSRGDMSLAPTGKYRYRCLKCRARYGADDPNLTQCDRCGGPLVKDEVPQPTAVPPKAGMGGPGMKGPGMGMGPHAPVPGHEGHAH